MDAIERRLNDLVERCRELTTQTLALLQAYQDREQIVEQWFANRPDEE